MDYIIPTTILVTTTFVICCFFHLCMYIHNENRMNEANKFIGSMGEFTRELKFQENIIINDNNK
jgi:hypothetical protein